MTTQYLCSFRPLCFTAAGRAAVCRDALPPFIDGSCRREPDFQSTFPSISALCRAGKFAPKLQTGDRVAYITCQRPVGGTLGYFLIALISVIERFESHAAAAEWYAGRGLNRPSNCMVPGNPPEPYHLTNQKLPLEVRERVNAALNPDRAIRLWDKLYADRAKADKVFLACRADFLELWSPPFLRKSDLVEIFGHVPGTQNPPTVTPIEYDRLACFARAEAINEGVTGRF